MFEIIMMFAFLYAAVCQLFPGKQESTKAPSKKTGRPRKEIFRGLHLPAHRSQTTPIPPTTSKNRSHQYAHAA